MSEGHGWRTKPGFSKLVLDRGAVCFDVPREWVVEPGEEISVQVLDKPSPDDDIRLEVSFNRLPSGVDWNRAPLGEMIPDLVENDHRDVLSHEPVKKLDRKDLNGAWTEMKFLDPVENREAYSRLLVAIGNDVQVLLTCEYWPEDAQRARTAWDEALNTLELGLIIPDPKTGFRIDPRRN